MKSASKRASEQNWIVSLGGGVDVIDKEVDTEYGDEGLCENVSEVDGG